MIKLSAIRGAVATTTKTTQNNRARVSAETSARAELAPLNAQRIMGKLKSWDDVQRALPSLKLPAMWRDEPVNDKALDAFKNWYVSTAFDRAAQQIKEATASVAPVVKQQLKVGTVQFRPQQAKAIDMMVAAYKGNCGGVWLPLGTGRGKTFVAGGIISWFKQQGLIKQDNFMLPQVFYFTKKSVVIPTREKLEKYFQLDCCTHEIPRAEADVMVSNFQALGTKRFDMFYKTETIEVFSQAVEVPVWVPREKLTIIIVDECHELKKLKSKRTKRIMGIARAARAAGRRIFWVAMSATNATTLADTMWMNYVTGLTTDLTGKAFLQKFVSSIKGASIESKIKAQMERYIEAIGPMYVRPPNDPLPYKIVTTAEIIEYPSPEAAEFVQRAEEDYIKSIEVIGGEVKNLDMAKFTLYRKACEFVKSEWYAEKAMSEVAKGRSSIVVVEFKQSLLKILSVLASKGVTRDKISIVKGPDEIITADMVYNDREFAAMLQRQDDEIKKYMAENEGDQPDDPWFFLSRREKTKVRKTRKYNQDMVRNGESRYEQAERTKWLLNMEVGSQSDQERHNEVQRFLNNETHYMLMTFSAGGTGIDADDRIPADQGGRPRTTISTVCYWAEQWLQALGRDARVTTLTDPHHIIAMFNRSIESQHVAPTLSARLNSMSAMTGAGGDIEAMIAKAIAKSGKSTNFADATTQTGISTEIMDGPEEDNDEDDDEDEN